MLLPGMTIVRHSGRRAGISDKLPPGVAQGRFRQVDADDLGVADVQRDAPGDAARAGAEVEHLRRAVQLHFLERADRLGDEQLRLGPRYEHARPHGEAPVAELRHAQHILDGLAGAQPLQVGLELRQPVRRDGRFRLHDMRVVRHAQQLTAEHQNQTPRLRRRV